VVSLRALALVVLGSFVLGASGPPARAAGREVSSLSTSPVTVYGAKWCPACRSLESGLADRKIPFDLVDVDENASAFARARAASGTSGAIPLTSVARSGSTVWILGADIEAVDRAQRGE
jgi:mycoredoxin